MGLNALRTALVLTLIILFAVFVYWDMLSYRTFGCEFASFFFFLGGDTFSQVLKAYIGHLTYPWYRPTALDLFYWFGSLLFDWHNVLGWKILELSAALLCCFLIYWLVLLLLPNQRLAAALAAIYYIASPNFYAVVFDIQGLDFTHILFCLLCFILFLLAFRSTGWRTGVFLSLSALSYLLAVTSKEIATVTPLFLTVAAGILLFTEGDPRRWLRTALLLLPFFLLAGAYWLAHVQRIPKDVWAGNGGYRMHLYWPAIIANLENYPFWIMRMYGIVPDKQFQVNHFAKWWSNLPAGIAAVAVVVVWCRRTWRDRAFRAVLFLMLAWMAIFLMVPVYSGGYYWHGNLAMAGYAVLFGYAMADLFHSIPTVFWRRAALCAFVLGFLFLARANAWNFLLDSPGIRFYRYNYTALAAPPLKPEQLTGPGKPLIYIEDRLGVSPWAYGGGDNLFKFIYLNKNIDEKSVPVLTSVPKPLCTEWLARPNAYFVYYDARYRWRDGTEPFREYCKGKM
jgi:hypothetical protein